MFRLYSLLLIPFFLFAGEFRPDVKWYQYETKNFRLIFNNNSKYLADQTYEMVENVYEKITAQLGYHAREKIDILFNDTSDLVLDYANYLTNTIMINTAKVPSKQIGPFTKNYLHNLISHELTHIVHLQMASINDGLYAFVRRTTAKGWLYPYFIIEGIAIYNEKQISGGGRLYNTSFKEQFMAFAKEDDFPSLTQIFQRSMVRWPMGSAPYLFGAKFVEYLVDNYGMDKVVASFRYFASQVNVTYEQAFFKIYGRKLSEEYNNFINHYSNLFLAYRDEYQDVSIMDFKDSNSYEIGNVEFITKDIYYAFINDFRSKPKIIRVENGVEDVIYEDSLLYETKLGFQGEDLFFTKISLPNIYDSKIVLVRLRNNQSEVIDEGVIDFSFNDNYLMYIKKSFNEETIIKLSDNEKEELYSAESIEAVAVSDSGEKYAFVENVNNVKTLFLSQQEENQKIVSGDIKDILFVSEELWFVAGKDGLSQLFRYNQENGNIYQQTNVLTGVYSPQVIDSKIFFITYTARGKLLASLDNQTEILIDNSELLTEFSAIGDYIWVSSKDIQLKTVTYNKYEELFSSYYEVEANKEPIKTASEYNMWFLKMMYLYPYFYMDNYGAEIAVSTYFADHLAFNTLMMNFYSSTFGAFYNFQYSNHSFYPYFSLQANKDGNNDYFLAGFEFPFRTDMINQNFFIGVKDYYDNDELKHKFFSLQYLIGSLEMYPYSISYEDGFLNQTVVDINRRSGMISLMNNSNLYLPGFYTNDVIKFGILGAYSKDFKYRILGMPGITYVRGMDINNSISGGILGKLTSEYRMPIAVIDELSFLGFYHKHTGLILFYDLADAKDSHTDFMQNPYWSYGVSLEVLGEFSNFYPLSLGIGIAKTSQKEAVMFFSLNSLLN